MLIRKGGGLNRGWGLNKFSRSLEMENYIKYMSINNDIKYYAVKYIDFQLNERVFSWNVYRLVIIFLCRNISALF